MLPLIDSHSVDVDAAPAAAWRALCDIAAGFGSGAGGRALGPALGLDPPARSAAPPFPARGSTIPGFGVAECVPHERLLLAGRHRFSRYSLELRVDPLADDRVRIVAVTRAEFPGALGRVYKGLVIGTRGHVLAVRGLLRRVARAAERGR